MLHGLNLAKPVSQMRKLLPTEAEWLPNPCRKSSSLRMAGSGLSVIVGPRRGREQAGGRDGRLGDAVKGLHQDLGLSTRGQCSATGAGKGPPSPARWGSGWCWGDADSGAPEP